MSEEQTILTAEIIEAGFKGTDGATPTGWVQPSAFIQWKGTDVCMDFHCECGAFCHFDGDFCYVVQCPHCNTKWEMPFMVYPRKVTSETFSHDPKMLAADEDHCDAQGSPKPVA
jgi:hypothetical protein